MKPLHVVIALCVLAVPWTVVRGQQAQLPSNPHGPLRAGVDCSDCHTPADWKTMKPQAKFDHTRDTRFALSGRHATVACARCHLNLRFDEPTASQAECSSCHVDVHRGNLAGECVRCHNTSDFHDVQAVAMHQRTGFPLTGAHLQAPCEGCHRTERNGAYSAVARDCFGCHRQSLAAATSVDHSGFPTDCGQCHAPFSWAGGTVFNHTVVAHGFALDGAHAVQRCIACHTVPGFALRFTPPPTGGNDCMACHRPDYQRVHASSGFPTSCLDCHTVTNWNSSFDHDGRFPIASGAHRGTSCTTCHTVPGDFKTFTCLTCHEHSQASMDSRHRGRSGYSYDSAACYRCHPKG